MRTHQEELRKLQDQLQSRTQQFLDLHKQIAKVRTCLWPRRPSRWATGRRLNSPFSSLQKPVDSFQKGSGPVGRFLKEIASLKEAVAERDILLSSITDKLNQANAALESQKMANEAQATKHAEEISR